VAARFALALLQLAAGQGLQLRLGLHVGGAVAGVVGRTRFSWDLWGDAVRGATAMERGGRPGGIRLSPSFAARLGPAFRMVEDGGGTWLLAEARKTVV
jgi:class 3 adenylate cyclase